MTIDKSFLSDGRPYLTTRQAALFVGYEPDPTLTTKDDPAIRSFYEWCRRRHVKQCEGREVWRRADLVAGVERTDQPDAGAAAQITALVREHAAQVAGSRH